MATWDNQQATSWFCGILEAEGTCGGSGDRRVIRISNTDLIIIGACKEFLRKSFILFQEYERLGSQNLKKLITLAIHGIECENLIKILGSVFQCRKQEFEQKLGASTTTRDAPLTSDPAWLAGMFEGEGCISLRESLGSY